MNALMIIFWLCIGIIAYTYFGYPIFLLIINRLCLSQKRSLTDSSNYLLKIHFLIAAFNEEKVIKAKLENTLIADYPKECLDIWIASDGSTDSTNSIVKEYIKSNNSIHLLEFPRTGKSGVINRALEQIKDGIVVFSDANTIYETSALKNLVKHFKDEKVGCVCGKLIYRNPGEVISGKGESFYWRYETKLKQLESKVGYVAGANGAIYAIRRSLFDGLPAGTINDDFTVSMKIVEKGYKSLYEENAIAYEDVAPDMKSEFKRHIRDGAGHYIAVFYLYKLLNPFLGLRSLIYWSHRIFRWVIPFILASLFFVNLMLTDIYFYKLIFYLQTAFYILAFLGWVYAKPDRKLPFFMYIPFYFCNLNAALLIGLIKVVAGRQKPTWQSTKR